MITDKVDCDKLHCVKFAYNRTYRDLLAIIPLQLLSYELSLARGLNPDMPRNLLPGEERCQWTGVGRTRAQPREGEDAEAATGVVTWEADLTKLNDPWADLVTLFLTMRSCRACGQRLMEVGARAKTARGSLLLVVGVSSPMIHASRTLATVIQ